MGYAMQNMELTSILKFIIPFSLEAFILKCHHYAIAEIVVNLLAKFDECVNI